ncbi:MAG: hypothetical protein ACYCZD_08575 [Rhodanobacter sp.]
MQLVRVLIKHALLFYVFVGMAIATLMGFTTKIQNQYWLASVGVATKGMVVEPMCQQHLSFSYKFEVTGATYHGLSVSDQCSQIKSGDTVLVHYLSANPKVSTAANPNRTLTNNIVTILMASLTGPAILLLIFLVRLREWKKSDDDSAVSR